MKNILLEPAVGAAEVQRIRFEVASLLSLALGAAFLGTGIAKIAATDFVISTFDGWNFPLWALVAIGVVETAAAVLTLIPTTRILGSVAIATVMIGAVGYHSARGELLLMSVPAAALFAAVSVVMLELSLRRSWRLRTEAAIGARA